LCIKYSWPLPIGHLGMGLYESMINELYFQGFTLLDQLKKAYYIDALDPSTSTLDSKLFNSVIILYTDDEKTDKERYENNELLQHLCEPNRKAKKSHEFSLREFMIKIFLTVVSKKVAYIRKLY
jgi:hypothetical protein